MTDTTQTLIDALNNFLNSGGGISEAINEELQEATNNQNVDVLIRTQAKAVLNARHAFAAVKLWQETSKLSNEKDRQAFELIAGEGNLKNKSLERSGDGYKFIWVDQAWKWWGTALLYSKQQNVFNAKEFDKMVKRGTELWKDTPNNFVDDLRGN